MFDYNSNEWILDKDIISDGVITQTQYQETEKITSGSSQRALPLALILALKGLAAIVGSTVVAEITSHFLKWGLSSGCKKFKKYKVIKSFCKATGYL